MTNTADAQAGTIERLRAAWALIEDPACWCTQQLYMQDADGTRWSWCATGAMSEVSRPRNATDSYLYSGLYALNDAARSMGYRDASHLNDVSSHDVVRTMYERAIAAVAQRGESR